MIRIVLREALLLTGCISVTVMALFAALSQGNSFQWGVTFLSRHFLSGGNLTNETSLLLLLKLCSPYLFIQSIRAYLWSQRSLAGRKWSNLYFFLLLALTGSWSLRNAWDLFYLMFALGDIPSELQQFLQLEGTDILIGIGSTLLAIRCFLVFINPGQGGQTAEK